jgi:signal transduction histidine kinase
VAGLESLSKSIAAIEAEVGSLAPEEAARRSFQSHQSTLSAVVDGYLKAIDGRLDSLQKTWRDQAVVDRGIYYKICRPLLEDGVGPTGLVRVLNLLDVNRRELEEEFAGRYEPFLRTLEQLVEGIDLGSALAVVDDDKADLEDRIRDLNAVAQVGITVEIVGHELESLDAEVRRNLMRLPDEVRRSSAFKLAYEAHGALTERLRFLSPLKVAGYRARESISGAEIAEYVQDFFSRAFQENRITFRATEAFRSISIVDLPSRIYPVFINLVNNAIYWVSQVVDREIMLDLVDGKVVVADSGQGVDPDDVPRLFELFFTRRREGRGVGLYLCKVNLAVAHHHIRYARSDDPKVLPGANFIIEFRGLAIP